MRQHSRGGCDGEAVVEESRNQEAESKIVSQAGMSAANSRTGFRSAHPSLLY